VTEDAGPPTRSAEPRSAAVDRFGTVTGSGV